MECPVGSQHDEQAFRQGNIPVLSALTVANPDQHALTVDVLQAQVESLIQAQATSVDHGQRHTRLRHTNKRQEVFGFFGTQNNRKLCPLLRSHKMENTLFPFESYLKEKLDAAEMNR